jgi:hypothetical protein
VNGVLGQPLGSGCSRRAGVENVQTVAAGEDATRVASV